MYLMLVAEIYYRPQGSCGKVMFLHLPVILFIEGGVLCPGVLCPGRVYAQGVSVREIPPVAVRLRAGGTHPTGMQS